MKFSSFFDQLQCSPVRWVVLRGYDDLPYSVSNDLDIGILPSHAKVFFVFIKNFCNNNSLIYDIDLIRFGCVKFHIRSHDLGLVKLDVWFDINFWGIKYLCFENAFENLIVDDRSFYRLSENDEFFLSFMKEILHNNLIREDKINHLKKLFKNNRSDIPLSFLIDFYLSRGPGNYFTARYLFLLLIFFQSLRFTKPLKLLKRLYFFIKFRSVHKSFEQVLHNVDALNSVK